ncbi:uncharacterized protein BDZ99DRAFT_475845 [Mytilinidion resinicola]|uniref:Uncharacterized protein n=1 Tax=Mytilinidion resinicola TaxID=574789 RepID=A0A6A6YSF6_9PEZI|nr:uncharacterized protein BDZ99DRAFT_475845 [Mytilinidion resinicola]KAF2810984.1 hypothetical protein BDZ99DRAFT_475845 [Mytilinidion resinicola]
MNILAYLLSAHLSALPEVSSHHRTARILFGSRTTEEGDEEYLQRFSDILLNREKDATFDALHKSLPFMWNNDEKYDTVNPFGDPRQLQYHALWTFDTQNDVLRYTSRHGCSQIPLALLRERVWRHVLRNRYNSMTLRVLARAIIRLSTLDFEVRSNTGGHSRRGVHVWITNLPAWEPFNADVVRVGNVYVVLCQAIQEGLSMAQQHVSSQDFSTTESPSTTAFGEPQAHYMILSVKHIMLCHATSPNSLMYTVPEPLFNGDYGVGPPSDLALDYLIWATASARPRIFTPLQSLPIEVHDIILDYVSGGTVVAAKVGCLLGLGSPFLWKDGPLEVTLMERYKIRPTGSSVESEVWFGEQKSGIVYLARRS